MQARREVERQNQNYVKVAKEKEILTQDKGELIVQVTATGNQGKQCYMYISHVYITSIYYTERQNKGYHLNSGEPIFTWIVNFFLKFIRM